MKKRNIFLLVMLISVFGIQAQVQTSSTGRVDRITTDFTSRIVDGQYDRELLGTGWISGIGDYLFLKHGGGNTEANTYGFRISDHKGFEFGKNDFSSSFLRINTSGNVGIGTAAPGSKLEVRNANNLRTLLNKNDQSAISFLPNNGNSVFHIAHGLNNDLNISQGTNVGAGKIMTIKNIGRVGIGTSEPSEKLDVSGNIKASSIILDSSNTITKASFGFGINTDRGYLFRQSWETGIGDYVEINNLYATGGGERVDYKFRISGRDGFQFLPRNVEAMRITKEGNVSIGTTDPKGYKLAVAGDMIATEIKVKLQTSWPDYVFEDTYNLPKLTEVEQHIQQKGHLINIPSAAEVAEEGIYLGEMNAKLLEKIEELTLYTIAQEKEIEKQEKRIQELESIDKVRDGKIEALEERIEKILKQIK